MIMTKTKITPFILLCFNFFITVSYSQVNKLVNQAEALVLKGDYIAAKEKYTSAFNIDSNNYKVNEGLGLLLFEFIDEKAEALKYIRKAIQQVKSTDTIPELYLAYAECLHFTGAYDEAINQYNKTLNYLIPDKEGELLRQLITRYIENCAYAIEHPNTKNLIRYKVRSLGPGINSKYDEYVPVVSQNENVLMYTSRRKDNLGGRKDNKDDKYYEDMFVSHKTSGKFSQSERFSFHNELVKAIKNTDDHDAIVSVSNDGKKLFMFRNNGIYESVLNEGKWSEPQRLSEAINEPNTFEAHAFLSNDGNVLYFSSNRTGGMGGLDLYRSVKDANGNWSAPQNLGADINTAEDEDSPYISADGKKFFFSSKGLNGFGDYDIFYSKMEDGNFTKPVNMGLPFNSPGDDIYFSIDSLERNGYFSSARPGGFGGMDLFQVFYFDKPETKGCITVTNQDPNAEFFIGFTSRDSIFVKDSVILDSRISKLKNLDVVRYFWKINDSLVNEDSAKIVQRFNKVGNYNVTLELATISDTSNVRMDFCLNKTISVFDPKIVEEFFEPLLRKNETLIDITGTADIKKIDTVSADVKEIRKIRLNPIYFNVDKSDLRPDALKTIGKNIAGLKEFTEVVIKITAHTDATASEEYNKKLAQKRANTVISYLSKKGISKDRILAVVAVGEAEQVDVKGKKLTKDQINQLNRRVEFYVVSGKKKAKKATAKKSTAKNGTKKPAAKKTK